MPQPSPLPGRLAALPNPVFRANNTGFFDAARSHGKISTRLTLISTSALYPNNHRPNSGFTLPLPRRSAPSKRLF